MAADRLPSIKCGVTAVGPKGPTVLVRRAATMLAPGRRRFESGTDAYKSPREMTVAEYTHPHPSPAHVMRRYRSYLLGCKKSWSTARGLIHYRRLLDEYLAAKRLVWRSWPRT